MPETEMPDSLAWEIGHFGFFAGREFTQIMKSFFEKLTIGSKKSDSLVLPRSMKPCLPMTALRSELDTVTTRFG